MPNVGRPSKGCKHCRDRKIKCDLKQPSCSQCIRADKECIGYRDTLSMMFKNESNIVMSKAQKKYGELLKKKTERKPTPKRLPLRELTTKTSPSDPSASPQSLKPAPKVSHPESPAKPISPSIENQALSFFAANNILQPVVAGRGNFQWLFEMLSGPEVDASLQSSAYATSLATLATANKSQSLTKKAQEHYAHALKLTNKALGDPVKVYEDSTLASVILLGTYESYMFESRSLNAWAQHQKGAGTLFALRGEHQFKSTLVRQIFMQFYRTTMAKGVEIGTPMSNKVTRLYRFLTATKDYAIHGVEYQVEIIEKAIELMQREANDPVTNVSAALELDSELDIMKFTLYTLWRYETVYLEKPAEHVFGNLFHIYTSPWVVYMWNILRLCRIRLFKFIRTQVKNGLQCSPPLFSNEDTNAHFHTCEEVIRSQLLDMCASTPQLMGHIAFPHQVKQDVDVLKGGVDAVNLRNKMFTIHPRGTFLEPFKSTGLEYHIGPLYELGRSDFGPQLTQWAVDQLYFIALKVGSRQAITLAEELEEKLRDESNFRVWHDPCPICAQVATLAMK